MKTIKQIISDADPRLKGVLVIMIAYVMVMAQQALLKKLKDTKKQLKSNIKMAHKRQRII